MHLCKTLLIIGTLGLLTAGCAPTLTEIHHVTNESPRAPIFKMVVLAANMPPSDSRVVEDGLVADLRERGVDARASHLLFTDAPKQQEEARNAILDQGYEAVLRVNLENIDTSYISTDDDDFRWTYVNIKTSLWDASNDRLVWSAETRTKNPTDERDLAKSISMVLLPALTNARLILPVREGAGPAGSKGAGLPPGTSKPR